MMLSSIQLSYLVALLIAGASTGTLGLENGVARTPPMGWMAWQRFACETNCDKYPKDCVDESLFKEMADRLASDGFRKAGYVYLNIDDCWQSTSRDQESRQLLPNETRFPSGIEHLAELVHGLDLKLGIYGDCGTATCAGFPAQLHTEDIAGNYFDEDAKSLASWTIDSFKFDGCNLDPLKAESICPGMTSAIERASKKPIMLTCEWIFYMLRQKAKVDYELSRKSCNMMRFYEDVEDSWHSVLDIIDFTVGLQDEIVEVHGPGHWMDPDQLVIGDYGLTLGQSEAQMAIWCMWSAPLFMGNDLRKISPKMSSLLQNEMLIEIDQDPMGIMGKMIHQESDHNNVTRVQVFVKPVEPIWNGCPSFAVAYLSRYVLGSKRLIGYPMMDIITKANLKLAEQRYQMVHPSSELTFNAEECLQRLKTETTQYHVTDLIAKKERPVVSSDSILELAVNPSSVAIVKLTEKFL